ncbi:MAG: class I SAM-dependent DNA methyltransferase [Ardenticatenales bacterium]|nr:class I SAM-dependent DNA methyltransferase [Ardenticatenales bacterium]
MTPQQFVATWKNVTQTERATSQTHFNHLCQLLGVDDPVTGDPTGQTYAFEPGVRKSSGGHGWADVWRRGHFGWEYKGPGRDLEAAYRQLLNYKDALENPPLLIVSDIQTIIVRSNFTNSVQRTRVFTVEGMLDPAERDALRAVWTNPEAFRSRRTTEAVTREAATQFAKLADHLRAKDVAPDAAAHYLIRLLFCLFAEDIGLLPKSLFTTLVHSGHRQPERFNNQLRTLFAAMSTGGYFGADDILHINGRLFDSADVIDLDSDALWILKGVCDLDWSAIEPAILGTLFTRSLDPAMRAQLGAQYTSRDDILLVVEPVLMAPLRRRWADVKAQAEAIAAERDTAPAGSARTKRENQLRDVLVAFAQELARIRVLDPACGSGNFLYVALLLLLDLWKEVSTAAADFGLSLLMPTEDQAPSPAQLHGIEINEYAHELAQVTIWIGYIQWMRDNGFGRPSEPVLKPIDTIEHRDAILAFDEEGRAVEPEWPAVDVIVGNPPFLGTKLMRAGLGDEYVERLFSIYDGKVARESDFVVYWFHRAQQMLAGGRLKRAGLLSTNSIRGGANRRVVEDIKRTGDIFLAWGDRPWILDGAAVRVSMVGFDDGSERERTLDGVSVSEIHSDLTSGSVDLTKAARLWENSGLAYMGDTKGGAFDVDDETATAMLAAKGNPNGRPNSDVVRPWVNGLDVTRRLRGMWIIDFGVDSTLEHAAAYQVPFEHVLEYVKPARDTNRRDAYRLRWWLHMEPRPAMRQSLGPLHRFICTPTVARHRLFVWLTHPTLPDHQLIAIARDDDYFFGVLHSHIHELWSLRMGTWLGVGNDPRYTPTSTFETFPFPWPPGQEPADDPRIAAIADAARALVEQRDRWLNPDGATDAELKKRTLTHLYNQRPTWLDLAHRWLDEAVLDAYGWAQDLGDEELLERLLALNMERSRS